MARKLAGVDRIELSPSVSETGVLPLYQTPIQISGNKYTMHFPNVNPYNKKLSPPFGESSLRQTTGSWLNYFFDALIRDLIADLSIAPSFTK